MTPDPTYLFGSRTHSEALASLLLGIKDNRGFFALIAGPGMGKTTLLYQILEELRETSRTVLIFQTQCNAREFIEYILHDLGVDAQGMSLAKMHGMLNEILFEELLAGKRFVLIVDEAQNLDDSVLETVRMLSNFETHNAKLLQIILAGQPRLAAKLAQPQLSQLRQRVAVLGHLEPFSVEESELYVGHRLKVSGFAGEPIFDPPSINLIARQSKGIPRNINNLCYTSLLLAHNRQRRPVTTEIVQEAIRRLDVASLASEPPGGADSGLRSVVSPPNVNISGPRPTPIAGPARKVGLSKPPRTYDAVARINLPKWYLRSAILTVIVLSCILLISIIGRSESKRVLTPATFSPSSSALGPFIPVDRSEGAATNYDAAPQDTGNGQVLTVMAGSEQTLRDLSMRYVGHFDSELSDKIRSLNPDLKDPDHLEAGQLIRIPLPPGAMKKVNDTAETAPSSKPETSGNLFTKFTALLRERK